MRLGSDTVMEMVRIREATGSGFRDSGTFLTRMDIEKPVGYPGMTNFIFWMKMA